MENIIKTLFLIAGLIVFKVLYEGLIAYIMKKTSPLFLFFINGVIKNISPKIKLIIMPADPSNTLYAPMWFFSFTTVSAFLSAIQSFSVKPHQWFFISVITCYASFFLLLIVNHFVKEDDREKPMQENHLFDTIFKFFKFFK